MAEKEKTEHSVFKIDGTQKSGEEKQNVKSRRGKHIPKNPVGEVKTKTPDIKAATSDILDNTTMSLVPPPATVPTVAPADISNVKVVGDVAKPTKTKAELKAERRAQQEAQRAKKAAKAGVAPAPEKTAAVRKDSLRVRDSVTADVASTQQKLAKDLARHNVPVRPRATRQVGLFRHLLQYENNIQLTENILWSSATIHPAIVKLGVQYANGIYCGSNSRCVALLAVFKKVIADYTTPAHKECSRDLDAKIKPYIRRASLRRFLTQCRPMSVSMGNAIKHIKWNINNLPPDITDSEAKTRLIECIDKFWKEKIVLAQQAIANHVGQKITDGDVIVVYACSSVIIKVLLQAKDSKKFRVIVVDSRPKMEGRETLRRLVNAGIQCSYIVITTASYVMKEATKVLLGAHALLANGYVMSRVGSSMLALAAKSCNVPVLVCCETYKFCERVQTDSFVFNELGDPDDLATIGDRKPILSNWRDLESLKSLNLLNLVYDVTPAEFISMVITELGMIPCTSVPVVLRVAQAKIS